MGSAYTCICDPTKETALEAQYTCSNNHMNNRTDDGVKRAIIGVTCFNGCLSLILLPPPTIPKTFLLHCTLCNLARTRIVPSVLYCNM